MRNLYFVQNLEENRTVEVFGHEWTNCPASLFEPDAFLDQRETRQTTWLQSRKALAAHGGEVDKLPLSDKPIVMVVDAISWLFVSRHTWFSQPTQLPLILGDNLSMANWWQP